MIVLIVTEDWEHREYSIRITEVRPERENNQGIINTPTNSTLKLNTSTYFLIMVLSRNFMLI